MSLFNGLRGIFREKKSSGPCPAAAAERRKRSAGTGGSAAHVERINHGASLALFLRFCNQLSRDTLLQKLWLQTSAAVGFRPPRWGPRPALPWPRSLTRQEASCAKRAGSEDSGQSRSTASSGVGASRRTPRHPAASRSRRPAPRSPRPTPACEAPPIAQGPEARRRREGSACGPAARSTPSASRAGTPELPAPKRAAPRGLNERALHDCRARDVIPAQAETYPMECDDPISGEAGYSRP